MHILLTTIHIAVRVHNFIMSNYLYFVILDFLINKENNVSKDNKACPPNSNLSRLV